MKIIVHRRWGWYFYKRTRILMATVGPLTIVWYKPGSEPPKPSSGVHPSGRR